MPFFRPTFCEIHLSAIRQNFRTLQAIAQNRRMIAMIKANAYGHGAIEVARALALEGVYGLGVATLEEGIALRRAGISNPIFCFGGSLGAEASDLLEFHLTPILFNEEGILKLAAELQALGRTLPFHLKIDTGMGRLGIFPEELPAIFKLLDSFPQLDLQGILTHLACADELDSEKTALQLRLFEEIKNQLREGKRPIPSFHLALSAALLDEKFDETDLVRPGIALYGSYPHPRFQEKIILKPALSWKTQIISLKDFQAHATISYGATFETRRPSRIAVIPVGYADGYSRGFSNRGKVLVRGRRAPVVGRVCMDMTMIDVTEIPSVQLGEEVVLLGSQGKERLSAEELAQTIGTISYEIFCGISARVPRIAISE